MPLPAKFPISFLVGVLSAVVLGMVWGIVYFNMALPPIPPAVDASKGTPPPTTTLPPTFSSTPPSLMPSESRPQTSAATSPPASTVLSPKTPLPPFAKLAPKASSAPPITPPQQTPTVPLVAQPGGDIPALQGISPECLVELEKLCEGVEPGAPRRKCFKENEQKLSPTCQLAFDHMAARIAGDMQHFKAACQGDVKRFCPQVSPGGGNILQCLEENYKEVSENCYQALKSFQKMKAGRSL